MPLRPRSALTILAVAVLLAASAAPAASTSTTPATSPGAAWEAYADPAEAGFSADALEGARSLADESGSAAVVVVYRGRVLAAWGAVDRPLMAHSVRKSLAGALYGQAIADGRLSLDATLADLRVDDVPPLTPAERGATFADLIAARSGVYHGAAYASDEQADNRPARGSHAPGTFWYYNNWDFNAAEAIYERATGQDLYQAFADRIARPVGMEDFDASAQLRVLEPGLSHLPAHTFRISARDLARFGQLYLDDGRWQGTQVVPESWVRDSLRPHSDLGKGAGYGYLWWTWDAGALDAARYPVLSGQSIRLARGTGGQAVFLVPGLDLVVVHRADTDRGRSVPGTAIWQMVERIAAARTVAPAARTGHPPASPRTAPMHVEPLAAGRPAPPAPAIVTLPTAALERLAGEYDMPGGRGAIRVFLYEERLFANVPGLGEAELFATSPTTFAVLAAPGASAEFLTGPGGEVTAIRIVAEGQRLEAPRRREPTGRSRSTR
ncbi:MAG: serine hydrolase [Vicinamibacterales bacterium]